MAASTSFINSLLGAAFRGQTYTGGTITMKLYTGNVPSSGGTEVTGGGYAAATLTFGAASNKVISTSANAQFTDLPSTAEIKAYAIFNNGTQIDEKLLTSPFKADVNNNTLEISYSFNLQGV